MQTFPVWDEIACDLNQLESNFQARRTEMMNRRQALENDLRQCKSRRRGRLQEVGVELRRPSADRAVMDRVDLHGQVRRHYAALRVMMELLQLRSEHERHAAQATVLPPNDVAIAAIDELDPDSCTEASDESVNLRIKLLESVPAGVFEEDDVIEISLGSRSRRAAVRASRQAEQVRVLELDLPADAFRLGQTVEVKTVARFGMWANQRTSEPAKDC